MIESSFLPPDVPGLIAALAIGLIIGLERGWHDRELPEGSRVAGLRTFTLIGLLGGVLGHLQPNFGAWPLVAAVLGLSLLLTVSYARTTKISGNLSATTTIAMLLTLVLGAYASHGNVTLALTAAVIVAVFLDLKPTLHGWLRLIEHRELTASSTAATVALARYARQHPVMVSATISGTLAACGIMFFRMVVLIVVIEPALLSTFGGAMMIAGILLLGMALWRQRQITSAENNDQTIEAMAPFDLGTAFSFAAFLAVMAVLVPAAKQWLGTSGIFVLSTISGLADVDAILVSLARLHSTEGLTTEVAAIALGLATLSNMLSKATIAWMTGGAQFGRAIIIGYTIAMIGAGITLGLSLKFT